MDSNLDMHYESKEYNSKKENKPREPLQSMDQMFLLSQRIQTIQTIPQHKLNIQCSS
jgi:hypothetical protein